MIVVDADVDPYVAIVQAKLDSGESFEWSLRAALKGVLLSPEFLFLREAPGRLDDDALASRLSYFLWSTMPDDELLSLAASGKLADKTVLGAQVDRMLKDPRSGQPYPAHFIQNVTATVNDKPVLNAQLGPAIAMNPLLSFRVRGAKPGDKLVISWEDNKGDRARSEAMIA